MTRRRTVEDWRREVIRSHKINDGTRVLLMLLADRMTVTRQVSVPRADLAKMLNRAERRISERIAAAHEAGFLSTISAGYRKHTAVYQGTFPDAESGTHGRPLSRGESGTPTSTLSGAETRTLSTHESGTHGGPTITRADLSLPGQERNGGSKDEQAHEPAVRPVTRPWWTREPPPDLEEPEPHADREESA